MNEKRFLAMARDIMSQPTATYHEHFPMRAVRSFAAARSGIEWRQDEFGNSLLYYGGAGEGSRKEPLMMTAHLDHPGLVYAGPHSAGGNVFEVLGGGGPFPAAGLLRPHIQARRWRATTQRAGPYSRRHRPE